MHDEREEVGVDEATGKASPTPEINSGSDDTLATDEATTPGIAPNANWETVAGCEWGADAALRSQSVSLQPRRFGDYELVSEIARGGMGVVYKARQKTLNRNVALKMILSGQLASEQEVQRFYIEAEAAANLDHPGIIPIYEIGQHNGQHFFSMGLVDGYSLDKRIKDGPLPPQEAVEITAKVTAAIAYAHSRGVIHRDLKPANILIDADGQPKVTDFGLAKRSEVRDGLTASGQILGTPSFMPPEQAAGKLNEVDPTSDVYSIGAVLYALLTGRAPFQSANVMDTLKQVIDQEPVPPRRLNPVIHADLETICLKCLAKSKEKRYESAKELGLELERYQNGEPINAKASTVLSRTWSTVLAETRHTEVLGMWSQVWWWHAGLVLILFSISAIVQWLGASPWIVAGIWAPGLLAMVYVVWHYRFRHDVRLAPVERQVAQVWGMFGVTAVLTGVINHMMGLDTLQLLPVVMLECGLAFCCMAAILGGSFYPIGIACFIVALLMPIAPVLGTAAFGTLIAIGLLIPAVKYGRIGD